MAQAAVAGPVREGARTGLVRLEELRDDELKELETSLQTLRSQVLPSGEPRGAS